MKGHSTTLPSLLYGGLHLLDDMSSESVRWLLVSLWEACTGVAYCRHHQRCMEKMAPDGKETDVEGKVDAYNQDC